MGFGGDEMSAGDLPPTEHYQLDDLRIGSSLADEIDALADEFERSWSKKSIDRINAVLKLVPESARTDLLTELLHTEFELRFANGTPVELEFYTAKLPGYAVETETIYRDLMATRRLGGYEYYEKIGNGGMGIVYRARQLMLERIVAIKLLHGHILNTPGITDRFLREIRLIGQLQHPNIVNAEYADKSNDRYYLAMELVDGKSVQQIVAENGPLPLPTACEIVRQAAMGIQYASDQGIVHRDIKPANLMITKQGIVKILDFGLGKFQPLNRPEVDHSLTVAGSTLGSVDYISPEQWENPATVTSRADIYSLGCTFNYLLTGRAPFENDNMNRDQKMIAHIKGEISSLHRFRDDIPPEIEACYQKMVAKNPNDRFVQPSEIPSVLAPFCGGITFTGISSENVDESKTHSLSAPTVLTETVKDAKSPPTPFVHRIAVAVAIVASATLGGTLFVRTPTPISSFPPVPHQVGFTAPQSEPPLSDLAFREPGLLRQAALLQFVGNSGKWWFDDVPWFLPVVRDKSIDHEIDVADDPDMSAKKMTETFLRNAADGAEKRLLNFLWENGPLNENNGPSFEPYLNAYLASTNDCSEVLPSVWHTQAIALHGLTKVKNEPDLGNKARMLYAKAIQGYEASTLESAYYLSNLCRFDLARLNFWFDGRSDDFQREVGKIDVSEKDAAPFRAELLVAPAEQQMLVGKQQDVTFADAVKLLDTVAPAKKKNIRLARLYIRYATALTGQWRLKEADSYWNKAIGMIVCAASEEEFRLQRSDDHAIECRLALAVAARYSGDLKSARKRCRELAEDIQDALDYSTHPMETTRLKKWHAIVLERLADCTLFEPSHFGKHPPRNARFSIEETEDLYSEALNETTTSQDAFVLRCKTAMVLFSDGSIEKAQQVWETARNEFQAVIKKSGNERATCFFNFGETIFDSPDHRTEKIRLLLDKYRLNSNAFDRYAGEKLDMQLYCARFLLEREYHDRNVTAVSRDRERYLDPILMQHLADAKEMRPFLRYYYDLAVRSRDAQDIIGIAETIRIMRCQRYSGTLAGTHLIFYFTLESGNGKAYFLPTELNGCRDFDLNITRGEVRTSVAKGKSLPLPNELVDLVQQARAESSRIEVSWDDSICWMNDHDRLTDEKWPFDESLDRSGIFGIVK